MIVWLTGQPGAGKTTIARALRDRGIVRHVIDGDDLRALMPNPGYDEAGRRENVGRAQAIAAYLDRMGESVAVALVSPYRDQREWLKGCRDVLEVYLHTTEIRGREQYFAAGYEPPEDDYLGIDTGRTTVDEAVCAVHRALSAVPSGA